jgi:adenylosuccinate synthase
VNSGHDRLEEFTSVTHVLRRVAEIDSAAICQAIAANQPTMIVLNHVDYVDASCAEALKLTPKAQHFVSQLASEIGQRVDLVGVGPNELVPFRPAYAVATG